MDRNINITLFLLLLIFVYSCGRREFSEEGIREIVKEINVKLDDAQGVELNWGSPEAYSIFTAYYSGRELIFINESYTYRSPAESFNRYYFQDGSLLHALIKKIEYTPSGKNIKGQKMMTSLEFYSDPDENILFYEKIVNRERATLTDDEAEEIFRHADALIDIAVKKSK